MNETVEKLLFSEHTRLIGLELEKYRQHEQALQLFLTLISISIGAIFFLLEKGVVLKISESSLRFLLIGILGIGLITFLRQIGIDAAMRKNSKALQEIRKKLLSESPEILSLFATNDAQYKKYIKRNSLSGVIGRALTKTQQKTFVVIVNSLIVSILFFQFPDFISKNTMFLLGLSISAFFSSCLLHAVFASWRFKMSENESEKYIYEYYI